MTNARDDRLIFGRYTREECGLPPRGREGWRSGVTPARVALVLLATAAAAWLGGVATARWREHWIGSLPGQVSRADPGDVPALLERGRMYAEALPGNRRMRRDLAVAVTAAAERLPGRLGYYATAAGLFRALAPAPSGGGRAGGLERFYTELTAANVFAEVKDYPAAFAALDRAEAALEGVPEADARSHRLLLVNAQAYFLAIADESLGGNPVKALELARRLVSSRDLLPDGRHASASAAVLDTMATAWHRVGDGEEAVRAQSLALGLADDLGLDVYLRHYDEFNSGIHPHQ